MNKKLKTLTVIFCLILVFSHQVAHAQENLAQQSHAIFEQHCLDCHGEFGSYADVLTIKHSDLIASKSVIPRQPDASEFYLRLLGDTDKGSQMPLGQDPLDDESIATIRRWIEAGAPDWDAIPKPKRDFITTESMLKTIHTHVTSLSDFDRSFARYFTLTHLYNAGATDANLRAYRIALSKLINSLSWGAEVIKPKPIDQEETIFYIDLRNYEWDIKTDKWYKIEQAYPYGVQLKSATYATLCEEIDCELPFIRADWFIATASLPPLYHEILDLPKTDRELETQLEVNIAENLKNAPGVRVWRAGFSESGVSVNNRIVERHKSRYGAYWKSYDFAGNVGKQNIFTHPLDFTHDGGEIIFNLPNGLQAYYLSTATGERLDEAPINIVSDAGSRDPVVRNGLSCMGCHTEGMKTFDDQVRSVIEQNLNPTYDKAQALRLYAEKSTMDALVREDIARYRQAIEAAGGVFGGTEPIQQLVKQFEGPLDAAHAAGEVGMQTDDFLKKIRENSTLQNAGLLVLGVEKGSIKRDAWESEFGTATSVLNLGERIGLYANMVLIPAGEFKMGSDERDAHGDEQPVHTVYADSFYIDRYEVTNAQYKAFIDANPEWGKDKILAKYHDDNYLLHWNKNSYPVGRENHPIRFVSWYAAMAYARWVGKRLPTEAEWEKAARGGLVGKRYPWGDLIDSNDANFGENIKDITPVGNYPANGYGLYDIGGNTAEWCLDTYDSDFYASFPGRNPFPRENITDVVSNFTKVTFDSANVETWRVFRGGTWYTDSWDVRVTNRGHYPPSGTDPSIGFRCVKDITPRNSLNPGVTFKLIESIKFAEGTEVKSIAKTDINALRDLPIRLGDEHPFNGITLINEKDEEIQVQTCREYDSALNQGYYPASNLELKLSIWFKHQCGLLNVLEKATIPQQSFIANPKVSIANLELLPFSLFSNPAATNWRWDAKRDVVTTYQKKVEDGELIVKEVNQDYLWIEDDGMGQWFQEMVRADFNSDGIEDILFFEYHYATQGTLGFGGIIILTRRSADGNFEVVRPSDPSQSSAHPYWFD